MTSPSLTRADMLAVTHHLAHSRSQAQRLIAAGLVQWRLDSDSHWQTVTKANQSLSVHALLQLQQAGETQYVSRGGVKLAEAIKHSGVSVSGLACLDIGQSTGGFTDCLLQHGATRVVGVDVGHSQLHPQLRQDPRVIYLEKTNARDLPETLLDLNHGQPFAMVVMDVSFISQTLLLSSLSPLVHAGGKALALVKPQFEAGPEHIGKQGLVRDAAVYSLIEQRVKQAWEQAGWTVLDYFPSAITGGDGNHEFFIFTEKR